MSTTAARARREAAANHAYALQTAEGSKAAGKMAVLGVGVLTLAHYTSPFFRRQTLPFKVFLVTLFASYGLFIGADNALLVHEAELRESEHAIRKRALMELSRQGVPPTESAIARWRDETAKKETAGDVKSS